MPRPIPISWSSGSGLVEEPGSEGNNDGYLLQYFLEKGVPILGVEPAANVAKVAMQKGIRPWSSSLVGQLRGTAADGNIGPIAREQRLAHVPD
jgi:hypothetical protein